MLEMKCYQLSVKKSKTRGKVMSFFKRLFRKVIGQSADEYSPKVKGKSADEYSPDNTPFPKIFFGPIPMPSAEGVYEARIGYLPNVKGLQLIIPQRSADNVMLLYVHQFFGDELLGVEKSLEVPGVQFPGLQFSDDSVQYRHTELPGEEYFLTHQEFDSSEKRPLAKKDFYSCPSLKLMKRCDSGVVCIDENILLPAWQFHFSQDGVDYWSGSGPNPGELLFGEGFVAFTLASNGAKIYDSSGNDASSQLVSTLRNNGTDLRVNIDIIEICICTNEFHEWDSSCPFSLILNGLHHPLGIKEGSKDFWRP
jgi:hypothetical protein